MPPQARALTGIKPSGTVHIGNYLGMIRPAIGLAEHHEAYYFIANYHALTTLHDAAAMRRYSLEAAATWVALGLDVERSVLFLQSDVPEVCELSWILGCVTPLGLLQRAHAYKDAQAKGVEISAGTFGYPVLMAADILAYDSSLVPVGRDQKQHVEIARDIAIGFNHLFGDVLTVPEPVIRDEVATIVGLDGRKMSKSYGNVIPLFSSARDLRKTVMRIVTDSTPVEDPKNPDTCSVFNLYRLFATPAQVEALAARYRAGGMGYGHAKQDLFDVMNTALEGPRERYQELMASPARIEEILATGGERARTLARSTLSRVREATGLKWGLTP